MDKEIAYIITLTITDLGTHGSVKLLNICYSTEYTKKLVKQYREKYARVKVNVFILDKFNLIDTIMQYDATGDEKGLCYFLWTKTTLTSRDEWD